MFTGFARTLNGRPLRMGDHKGRPCVLRVSVWLACRSRRHASASEHLRHNPTVAGLSICVGRVVDLRCVLTYPQLLAGTVADRVGRGGFETCPCRDPVSSLPQTGVSLFDCRYPCEKGALTLDAAILLCAGADARRRWRLVVIMVLTFRNCQARVGGIFVVVGLEDGLWRTRGPFHPHPRFKPGAGSSPLPSREMGRSFHPPSPGHTLRSRADLKPAPSSRPFRGVKGEDPHRCFVTSVRRGWSCWYKIARMN